MKIGIIVGSIREGRAGTAVGEWVLKQAEGLDLDDAEFALIELADFNLPLLTSATVPGAAKRQYDTQEATAWGREIDSLDSFIFVTPEYNHGVPGAFKNAIDSIYPEWANKAVGFVAYGADGGVRSVENWRTIVANLHLYAVRAQVSLSLFTDFADGKFQPQERRVGELKGVVEQVVALGNALKSLRS